MIKRNIEELDDIATEYTTSSVVRSARLRREAKTGPQRSHSKRRVVSKSRRKNKVFGGIHLRGGRRTLK